MSELQVRKGSGTRSRGNSRNSRNSRGRQGGRSPNRSPNRSRGGSRSPNGRGPRANSAGGRPKRGSGAGRGPRPARKTPAAFEEEEPTVFGSETFGGASEASSPAQESTMLEDDTPAAGGRGSGFGLVGMLVVGFVMAAAAVAALAFIPGSVGSLKIGSVSQSLPQDTEAAGVTRHRANPARSWGVRAYDDEGTDYSNALVYNLGGLQNALTGSQMAQVDLLACFFDQTDPANHLGDPWYVAIVDFSVCPGYVPTPGVEIIYPVWARASQGLFGLFTDPVVEFVYWSGAYPIYQRVQVTEDASDDNPFGVFSVVMNMPTFSFGGDDDGAVGVWESVLIDGVPTIVMTFEMELPDYLNPGETATFRYAYAYQGSITGGFLVFTWDFSLFAGAFGTDGELPDGCIMYTQYAWDEQYVTNTYFAFTAECDGAFDESFDISAFAGLNTCEDHTDYLEACGSYKLYDNDSGDLIVANSEFFGTTPTGEIASCKRALGSTDVCCFISGNAEFPLTVSSFGADFNTVEYTINQAATSGNCDTLYIDATITDADGAAVTLDEPISFSYAHVQANDRNNAPGPWSPVILTYSTSSGLATLPADAVIADGVLLDGQYRVLCSCVFQDPQTVDASNCEGLGVTPSSEIFGLAEIPVDEIIPDDIPSEAPDPADAIVIAGETV